MSKSKLSRIMLVGAAITASAILTASCGKKPNAAIVDSQSTEEITETKIDETTENKTDGTAEAKADDTTVPVVEETTESMIEESTEEPVEETEPIVYFSSKSGFYDEGFTLELRCPVENAEIYYTTDGTIPDRNSIRYEGAITLKDRSSENEVHAARTDYCVDSQYVPIQRITKANVIRAIAYFADGTSSIVTNGTYFVGIDREELYGDAPVISLLTDPYNLFDEEYGIFVLGNTYDEWLAEDPANAEEPAYRVHGNFSNKGKEWERPVAFEYIPATGKNVSADMGLRMKGASTRTYLQKSMRLIAREEYGQKSIKAELIPGNMKSDQSGPVTKYKSFVLRNGGNDNGFGKMRDPFLQKLVEDRSMETQQSTPCVVFIDGEYWGLYAITEDYSDNYIEINYGIDNNNVVIVKCGEIDEGMDEDIALYEDMYYFITGNDMTDMSNYEKVKDMLDIPGFIDYCAMQLYIYNHDTFTEDNNWSLWRTREADNATEWSDGKWRILLYDTEFSTGVYSGGVDFGDNNLKDALDESLDSERELKSDCPLLFIFRSLYKNDEFKRDFINTLCDLRNYNFEKSRASQVIKSMAPQYQKLAGDSFFRYGPDWIVMWNDPDKYYSDKIEELKKFMNGRYMAFPNIMEKTFDLESPVTVTITVDDASMGDVILNNTHIDFTSLSSGSFSGKYFKEYELTLTAAPKEGYKFAGWSVEGCSVSDEKGTTTTVTLTQDCTIKAEYTK